MQSKSQVQYNIFLDRMLIVNINNNKLFITDTFEETHISKHIGINQVYQDGILKKLNKNYIAVHDMGTIPYLEKFILSSFERNICNKEGLYIFCTEQIIHTNVKKQKINLENFEKLPNMKIDFQHTDGDIIWSPELESIEIFVKNNNLKNVKVCVSCYDQLSLYNYSFDVIRWDATINALSSIMHTVKRPTQIFKSQNIEKRFWCGNWGYRPHRHLVTAFASTLDTLYSWGYTDNNNNLLSHIWFDYNSFKHKEQLLKGYLNLRTSSIDLPVGEEEITGSIYDMVIRPKTAPAGPDILQYSSEELFDNTFVSIVNSTSFGEPFPVYDEKPLNAIINYRPFILVGPPGSLELMRKDGFKTFGDFWDESYDQEWNHKTRLEMIFDLMLEINDWSIEKCQQTHTQMEEILKHNYNNINYDLQSTI